MNVRDNPEASRFEILDGDERIGFVDYKLRPGTISFVHTETDPSRQGEGVATVLIRGVLTEARMRGLDVLPFCPFVRGFIVEHRDFADLVPGDRWGAFGLE